MLVPNSQNFPGLYLEPSEQIHEGPSASEYDTKPPAPKLRNPKFKPNGPNWKFLAHNLTSIYIYTYIYTTYYIYTIYYILYTIYI